ncbi:MAG: helix-turn-helix transcriptional regulator [Kofleriaceae bacterium]|nr:helix-turn-helix transcriptional regulator [Kofleriaceae bacterium]
MAARIEHLGISVPGYQAVRTSVDVPYVGLKDAFCITRFESGRSEFWANGRVWSGRPGVVVIQQPGDVHRDVTRDGPIAYQVLRFPAHAVERVIGRIELHACLAASDTRAAAFQRLHDAVAARADRFTLECLIAEALDALAGISDGRELLTRPVRRALAMIRERVADPITLDELARHAGLDKFHLCRAFRAQVGMPPHAYLTHLRIMHAKELLAAGARAKDIAPQVGLYDQSQLNRHFRRIVGMTPGEFARHA